MTTASAEAPASIRVLLVDDQELIRVGFGLVLGAEPGIEVVGEAGDGARAIELVVQLAPDVVLMDIRMPRMDGIQATSRIVAAAPATRVIVLTTFDLDEYAFGAIEAGASGFLLKDAGRGELVRAIRAVHDGDAVLSPRVTRLVIEHVAASSAQPAAGAAEQLVPELASLTEREREVFATLVEGLSNQEIAARLFLGESTVKTHVSRILAKLEARDRVHLVLIAHRAGLL